MFTFMDFSPQLDSQFSVKKKKKNHMYLFWAQTDGSFVIVLKCSLFPLGISSAYVTNILAEQNHHPFP